MFGYMPNLIDLDLSSATFESVINSYYMFGHLNSIKEIRLPEATFDNVLYNPTGQDNSQILIECNKLETLYIPKATFENFINGSVQICNTDNSCRSLTRIYCTKELYNKFDDTYLDKQNWIYEDELQCAIKK